MSTIRAVGKRKKTGREKSKRNDARPRVSGEKEKAADGGERNKRKRFEGNYPQRGSPLAGVETRVIPSQHRPRGREKGQGSATGDQALSRARILGDLRD